MGGIGFSTHFFQFVDGANNLEAQPFFIGSGQWFTQSPFCGFVDQTHARCGHG